MVNIAANMTQVLTNSPQVTALVAGEAGAFDQIRRLKQLEQSRRFEEEARSKVLAAEQSFRAADSEEEARPGNVAVSERREGRRRSRAGANTQAETESSASSACAASPFETHQVIDLCV